MLHGDDRMISTTNATASQLGCCCHCGKTRCTDSCIEAIAELECRYFWKDVAERHLTMSGCRDCCDRTCGEDEALRMSSCGKACCPTVKTQGSNTDDGGKAYTYPEGTLTTGDLESGEMRVWDNASISRGKMISLAEALTKENDHPVSKAVHAAINRETATAVVVIDIESVPGSGTRGVYRNVPVKAGKPFWLGVEEHPTAAEFL